ncbi:MAG: diaminopimelate decarboxylase [SAR324 cluster bacterium]|uniref:Diaminopimelate decarboxylase n=1 Tax=SAR324 cluster bacterium TaxID=2024889 RepID=A0A7X9FS00_9DELT|nr:diaminopimelate decarboxylase [SAR324 cluster bacterium]
MVFDRKLLTNLAEDFGTPLYVYAEDIMRKQFGALSKALSGLDASICYAVKANGNMAILKGFGDLGAGFDVVSQGEILRVLKAGFEGSKIVFSGVAKSSDEIELALSKGVRLINVESIAELKVIEEIASKLKKIAPISFRINPDISIQAHPYICTGLKTSKFGIAEEGIPEIWAYVKQSNSLNLMGLDCHIGSQISDIKPFQKAYAKIVKIASSLEKEGAKIQTLDFGGGLGVSFSGHYEQLDLEAYGKMLKKLLEGLPYSIIVEPGKFLMSEAGVLITRVLYLKRNGINHFIITDAGMNDLIRPALYDAFHKIDLLVENSESRNLIEADIVGPVCESGCYFAKKRSISRPNPGEYLMIHDAGAYGMSMASRYNARRLPAELMLMKDGTFKLIRQRDSFEDLWRNEIF